MNKVAIYADKNFNDEIVLFSPVECIFTLPSRVIKAPVEGGAMSFDNKVRDPITIKIIGEINLALEGAEEAVRKIWEMYHNREFSFYSVSTKDAMLSNVILQNAIDRTSDKKFDIATYELEFVEAMIIQGSSKKALDPANDESVVQGYKAVMLIGGGA